eukprot:scaffold18755_cov20-Tisochrysis_lutea.AAC.3
MAPSGVQKERMQPEDIFVLDAKGQVPPPLRCCSNLGIDYICVKHGHSSMPCCCIQPQLGFNLNQ